MKQRLIIAAAAFVAITGVAVAQEVDLSKLPPASTKKDLTYTKDIEPLFKASCYNCHGSTGRPRGGLRLDSLEAALKGNNDGKVIIPGDSAKSPLVVAIARIDPEHMMPPAPRRGGRGGRGPGGPGGGTNAAAAGTNAAAGGTPPPPPPKNLTPEEVGLVRAWIDQGAK